MTAFTDRRAKEQREAAAAKKAAGVYRTIQGKASRADFYARLAEIPEDTRSLTARLCGDPIPNDPRRVGRTA